MSLISDKYVLIALTAVLIVFAVCIMDVREPPSGTETTGVVSNVRRSDNGFTFDLTDANGENIRCFFSEMVEENAVHTVTGRFSDDGSILFVNRIIE